MTRVPRNTHRLRVELLMSRLWYIAAGSTSWTPHSNSRPVRTSLGKSGTPGPATTDILVEEDVELKIKRHTLRLSRMAYIRVVESLTELEKTELSAYFIESQTRDARVLRRPFPLYQRRGRVGYQINATKKPSKWLLTAADAITIVAVVRK